MSAMARSVDGLSIRWEIICSNISCGKMGGEVGIPMHVVGIGAAFGEHGVISSYNGCDKGNVTR